MLWWCSVEVAKHFATSVFSFGLFVVHDSEGGGEDDIAKLSGGQDVVDELLEVLQFKIISWGDHTAFIQSAVELNNDLTSSLIVNYLEFVDVTYSS